MVVVVGGADDVLLGGSDDVVALAIVDVGRTVDVAAAAGSDVDVAVDPPPDGLHPTVISTHRSPTDARRFATSAVCHGRQARGGADVSGDQRQPR